MGKITTNMLKLATIGGSSCLCQGFWENLAHFKPAKFAETGASLFLGRDMAQESGQLSQEFVQLS